MQNLVDSQQDLTSNSNSPNLAMTELKILADIISTGIDKIQAACDAKNAVFPPLDEPFAPESDAIRMEVYADVVPVIAAAHQLIAALQMPTIYAMSGVLSVRQVYSFMIANSDCCFGR